MTERLPPRPGEAIRRDRPVSFAFDRHTVAAFEGDTIGSALAAGGVSITGRSFKYHRARGLFCMTGGCPNCLMQVDGIPNVRSCTEPVRDGMHVERQNAWPSADHDIHGWLNTFSFMMPPGFYYKIFHRPRWAWKTVEPFIRSKAGLGKAPKDADHEPREVHNLHADVLVIGAGAAGLAAAAEAAGAGASTVVLEERAEVGAEVAELAREAEAAGARIIAGTPAFGVFGGPLIAAANGDRLYRIRARHLVFATGAVEQAAVFPNNDLPGVMLSSAVDLLVDRYRVLPGRRAVVLTSSAKGYETARGAPRRGRRRDGRRPAARRPTRRRARGHRGLHDRGRGGAPPRQRGRGRNPGRGRRPNDPLRLGRPGGVPGPLDEPARDDRRRARVRRGGAGVPAHAACPRTSTPRARSPAPPRSKAR